MGPGRDGGGLGVLVSSELAISISCIPLLLAPLVLFGATGTLRVVGADAATIGFGCAGAIGTTLLLPAGTPVTPPLVEAEFGLVAEPAVDLGDSESFEALIELGVVTAGETWATEFLREDFLDDRVEPTFDAALPLPRFLFLITSVLSDSGRTTPCSLRKRPHALHNGCPSGLRRQSGVVCVKQLVHVVGCPPSAPGFVPPGLVGLDGAAELMGDLPVRCRCNLFCNTEEAESQREHGD